MSKNELKRTPGSVFVSVTPPASVQQQLQSNAYFSDWTAAARDIAKEDPPPNPPYQGGISNPSPNGGASPQREPNRAPTTSPETSHPTADDLLASHLPQHIEGTRWGRYVAPGPASRIFDGRILVYHDPCPNFWELYNLGKGILRDLGIKVSKSKGVWEVNIPIAVLTDKVFVESGLAGVEKTLMAGTGIDPGKLSAEIRHRQFEASKRGYAKVKRMRAGLADAVGLAAIIGVSWLSYIVMGGVL